METKVRSNGQKKRNIITGRKRPFQPAIGTDFGNVGDVESKTRDFLVKAVASFTVACVTGTGGWGLLTGDYVPVIAVWSVTGPIVGTVFNFYFGSHRSDTG